MGFCPTNPKNTPRASAIIPLNQYFEFTKQTQVNDNIIKANISGIANAMITLEYNGKNKKTNAPQISPLAAAVVTAADNALAPSPLRAIGNPSTIVAAAPAEPGMFITTPEKLSPIAHDTTTAVLKTTSEYGSERNISKNPYISNRPVETPATGIIPMINPYPVPSKHHKIYVKDKILSCKIKIKITYTNTKMIEKNLIFFKKISFLDYFLY